MIARLDLNQYEGDGNVFQDVSLLVNEMLYLCHQKMLKSALKKQKNATLADAIMAICSSKSSPVCGGKMEVKITAKRSLFLKIWLLALR